MAQMEIITSHNIPHRYSPKSDVISRSLHGFADASQEAYGAVVYIQQTYLDGSSATAVVISKARVILLKGLTIPRAELAAAYVLAKLLKYCSNILDIQSMTAWSDSSIVLCWLRKSPNSLNTFIANRVRHIHQLIPGAQWRHVSSASNPADMLSRGIPADSLVKSDLWWEGPPWIKQPQQSWPTPQFQFPEVVPETETRVAILSAPAATDKKLWDDFSSFSHMIISWCRRFINNLKSPADQRCKSHLQTGEVNKTKFKLFTLEQKDCFPEAFKALDRDTPLPKGHALRKYHVMRENAGPLLLSTMVRDFRDSKQPLKLIALSLRSSLTRLLVSSLHRRYLHPGIHTLLSIINNTYHIPALKNYLKGLSRQCPQCQRAYDRGVHQTMGLLPAIRTTPAPPFTTTGVDFADNNLQWKFIPPRTPHMGGLWESAVKSMKWLMRKLLQTQLLRTDELSSILVEIEAVLNSRPITPLESTDPDNLALTPGHFLIGRPMVALPTLHSSHPKLSTLRRWQLTQRLSQDIWHQWKTTYLQSLQQRHAWNKRPRPFKVGDVVFLREESLSYRQWPLAKITKTLPGDDGITRVVEVLCKGKTLQRATIHLIPFMEDDKSQDICLPIRVFGHPGHTHRTIRLLVNG